MCRRQLLSGQRGAGGDFGRRVCDLHGHYTTGNCGQFTVAVNVVASSEETICCRSRYCYGKKEDVHRHETSSVSCQCALLE
jgi:hypothetical protein